MPQVHTLDNGLTVVLVENHTAPVISFNVLMRVGSAVETPDEAGICHVIEHMLFKGTPKHPVGEIARAVEAAGGEINAYTSFDQTVYYINMASRYADRGLDILSDAVLNPLFDADELARESEVICEEIRRSKDNPNHEISEKLFAQAYGSHPYALPIIGSEKTVKSFTHKKLRDFYRKWYVPSNSVFIVVGDFDSRRMLDQLSNIYKSAPLAPRPSFDQARMQLWPEVNGPTLTHETSDIQSTYFSLGFPIPNFTARDAATLDLVSQLLSGNESSRLEQTIREKRRLVQQIFSYSFTPKGTGLFVIGGVLQAGKLKPTLDATWKEINRLYTEAVTAEELQRAKLNLRSNRIYEKETVGGEAAKYASFLAVTDDIGFEDQYYRWIEETTPDDIMQACKNYLKPSAMSGILITPRKVKVSIPELVSVCRLPAAPLKTSPKPKLSLTRLPSGMRLVVLENHHLPLVSVCVANLGGLRFENARDNGINTLIAETLSKGTKTRSALDIAQGIDAISGSLAAFSGRNTVGLKGDFLSDKTTEALDLFMDVLQNPIFPEAEVAKERHNLIEAIRNQEDQLASLAFFNFCQALYGRHPYSMRSMGSEASVKRLTRNALARYYARAMTAKNAVMTVVGDVDAKSILAYMKTHGTFGKGRPMTVPKVALHTPKKPVLKEVIKPGKQQAHIVTGFLGCKYNSPDYYPLLVLNEVLAGQGGRLFLELRDKLSLAYTVSSSLQMGIDPGFFSVYIGTDPAKVPTALDGIRRELRAIVEKPVSPDEIARAQEHLIGTNALDQQRLGSLATHYAFNLVYGLKLDSVSEFPDKVAAVSREQLQKVAQKYFRFGQEVTAIIKPK